MKIHFNKMFKENKDGTIEALKRVRMGGVTIREGTNFDPSSIVPDLTNFTQNEFNVDMNGDLLIIKGIHTL